MIFDEYIKLREVIVSTMMKELSSIKDEEQELIMTYTANLLSSLEQELNVKLQLNNDTMLHTGPAHKCCLACDNYKEGSVQVCNCALPYIETFKNMIGE